MTLAISIDTHHGGKPNFAMATITTVGDRTAVDFNYIRKPTVAEVAVCGRGRRQLSQIERRGRYRGCLGIYPRPGQTP